MANSIAIPKAIYLYNETVIGLDFKKICRFIKETFGDIPLKIIKLKNRIVATKGIVFDPIKTKDSFERLVHNREACHIIITDHIFATFDEDKRLHVRASVYGFPSVISISGIVEGPAKPRDYYLYKDKFTKLGTWPFEEPKVKRRFKGRFIDYGDRRMNEVLKGYISQALFFHMTGDPFCAKRSCRLFNAHWQEDLIRSQIKIGKFCSHHKRILSHL